MTSSPFEWRGNPFFVGNDAHLSVKIAWNGGSEMWLFLA